MWRNEHGRALLTCSNPKLKASRLLHRYDIRFLVSTMFSRHLIVPFKTSYLQNTSPSVHFNNYYSRSHSPRQPSRFLECLSRPFAKKKCLERHTSESNYWNISEYQSQQWREMAIRTEEKLFGRKKEEEEEGAEEIVDSLEDARRRVVVASPHLRVDERAVEFIHKFKQQLRIEKERYFLESQERLVRSAGSNY